MNKRAAPKYDRAVVMRDAHRRYRNGLRHRMGWTFGHCLATAWADAKLRREAEATARTVEIERRIVERAARNPGVSGAGWAWAHRLRFSWAKERAHLRHIVDWPGEDRLHGLALESGGRQSRKSANKSARNLS